VDGHDYIDFCLGDTGAMAGHGAAPTIAAVERQLRRGITTMLPTEDAIWAGEELTRRFGLPYWQFAITATDANRFALRLARMITDRPLIAVHDHNYHGTVDETFAWLTQDGRVESRRGNLGPQVDPAKTTRVVPFNDLGALDRALADREVAAFLIEPALTNVGIVLPEPGYLEGVRELATRHGTVLIHDETHTICAGPGGVTGAGGYTPDMLVIGKTIGGGIPAATYGMSAEVAERITARMGLEDADVSGIGGTLAGYALSLAAVRATLGEVLTDVAFARMIPLAERWEAGVNDVLARHEVPWHVTRLGARAEYHFMPTRPRNGADQWANGDFELERFLHLWAMNRGILMTPFHNMALMSPATTEADVDRHTDVFEAAVDAIFR
jgi:glutamate-1-semialdehyde aminotransferase